MERRNVILITIDSLRRDFLGCYGYGNNISPSIDRLAGKGVLFENAWANGPNTPHAFKSIMMGRHPLEEAGYGVFEKEDYLPCIFNNDGYQTIGIVGTNPLISRYYGYDKGFDIFEDFMDGTPSVAHKEKTVKKTATMLKQIVKRVAYEFGNSFYVLSMAKLYDFLHKYEWDVPLQREHYHHTKVLDKLESVFGTNGTVTEKNKVFLWVHFMDVHHPYGKPENMPYGVYRSHHDLINIQGMSEYIPTKKISVEVIAKIRRMYEQSVRDMDSGIERLLSILGRHGLLNNSSLFVLSDHGDLLGEHRLLGHRRLIPNELLKIPAIIYEDDVSGSGTVCREPVSQRDVYKMILESREHPVSGWSSDRGEYKNDKIFSEMYCDSSGRMYLPSHSAREEHLFKLNELARKLYSLIIGDKKLTYYESEGKYTLSTLSNDAVETSLNDSSFCQEMINILNQHMDEEKKLRGISKLRGELCMTIGDAAHKLHMKLKDKGKDIIGHS